MAPPRKLHKNIRHEMSFPPNMLTWLRLEAARRDTSVAEVVRDAVLRRMKQSKP